MAAMLTRLIVLYSGVSRNLKMCMHILEIMNSIVYLAQSKCGGLRWRDWFWDYMSKSQSSISMLILSNWETFLFSRTNVIRS